MDFWIGATFVYLGAAVLSFVPVAQALHSKVTETAIDKSKAKAKETIEKAQPVWDLDQPTKEAIFQNFERLAGTLVFWKVEAAKYKAAYYYCLLWTIPSAVVIPILTQAANGSSNGSILVTVVSAFTAILLAFSKGLKVEENYRAFRHGESEFYDLFRRMLDRPQVFGKDPKSQLDSYLAEAEKIRRFVRNAETNNMATLDEARQLLKAGSSSKDGH